MVIQNIATLLKHYQGLGVSIQCDVDDSEMDKFRLEGSVEMSSRKEKKSFLELDNHTQGIYEQIEHIIYCKRRHLPEEDLPNLFVRRFEITESQSFNTIVSDMNTIRFKPS